jgi:hypothetical protein
MVKGDGIRKVHGVVVMKEVDYIIVTNRTLQSELKGKRGYREQAQRGIISFDRPAKSMTSRLGVVERVEDPWAGW